MARSETRESLTSVRGRLTTLCNDPYRSKAVRDWFVRTLARAGVSPMYPTERCNESVISACLGKAMAVVGQTLQGVAYMTGMSNSHCEVTCRSPSVKMSSWTCSPPERRAWKSAIQMVVVQVVERRGMPSASWHSDYGGAMQHCCRALTRHQYSRMWLSH